jgi:hypothetical protein
VFKLTFFSRPKGILNTYSNANYLYSAAYNKCNLFIKIAGIGIKRAAN